MPATSYTIPSATTPGRAYRVIVFADGVMSCDCPDATYRRRQCKHQRQVLVVWTARGIADRPAVAMPTAHGAALAWQHESAALVDGERAALGRW